MFLFNTGVYAVSALTLGYFDGSSCTLGAGFDIFFLVCEFRFYFNFRNFLAVVLKIASNFLSSYIPIFSIAVENFTLSAAASCCADCMTAYSGVYVEFVMYL